MASVEKALLRCSKIARTGNKDEQVKKVVLERVLKQLEEGEPVRTLGLDEEEKSPD